MNLALFYDSETNGLPLYKEPSEHPAQPHIVQLAACLVDMDTRKVLSSMDVIVRPAGWEITAEMTAIHGISMALAMDAGVLENTALEMLTDMWGGRRRIGHNESFDARIIRIAQHRHGWTGTDAEIVEAWKAGQAECTQRLATPMLTQVRHARGEKGKTASLSEAHEMLVGKPHDGAHSAMGDVLACMAVYFAIQDAKAVQS